MKWQLFCNIFFFLFVQNISAQNLLTGTITGREPVPLPGVNVFIHELNKGTVSDKEGKYYLAELPNGKFRIQYSFVGYSSEVRTIFFDGNPIKIDIVMQETSIETKEVVISGGYNATQHENAVNIDRLKLEASTNILTPNTTEMLTRVPGVNMISKGPGVAKPVIRGLSMDNVLVLNNGVRNENYQYSDHHPLGLDEFGIEDVEIIKGPASLLYGPDAIGGVVNFIKERPAPVGQISGDYQLRLFSNTLGVSSSLGLKGASKSFFGGFRIGLKSNADFLQGGGEFVPNSRFSTFSLKADGGYTGKKFTSKLYYEFNRQKLGLTEDEAVENIAYRDRKNEIWYQQFNNHLVSSQNKIFLNKFKVDLEAAIQSVELVHYGDKDETEIAMRLSTLSYSGKLYLPSTQRSEYIIGFQGFNQVNYNIPGAEEILLPDAVTGNYGIFTLLQYHFFRDFKAQAGLRYDFRQISTRRAGQSGDENFREALARDYGNVSGSVGATYNWQEKLFIRANFAAAYRTPNLAELTSSGMHEMRYELGDSALVPQRAYETDLSLHYHIKNLTLDLAGFYNGIRHYIYLSPTGDTIAEGQLIYSYTQSDASLFGGEAGFHFHPEELKWLHIEGTFSSVTGLLSNGDHLPFIPAKRIDLTFKLEKEKLGILKGAFISLNGLTVFNQMKPAPEEETTDGYSLINFNIGTSIMAGKQEIYLEFAINNLFDKKYTDHLSTLKEAGFFDPGRNFTLSLSLPFNVR